jgi:hypothetical protein
MRVHWIVITHGPFDTSTRKLRNTHLTTHLPHTICRKNAAQLRRSRPEDQPHHRRTCNNNSDKDINRLSPSTTAFLESGHIATASCILRQDRHLMGVIAGGSECASFTSHFPLSYHSISNIYTHACAI